MKVLIIGGGASGLVTAKTLRERGHQVSVVEAASDLGGTFENKRYKDGRMVSSKVLTAFSDFRASPEAEMHMTLKAYVDYLKDYAAHFDLHGIIRLNTKVQHLERTAKGDYLVTLHSAEQTSREEWEAVAICSGLHNIPKIPSFEGQNVFKGEVLHSSAYKDPKVFQDKHVLVVGSGETGFDVAHAAANEDSRSVALSTRHGFVSVPAFFGGDYPPLDCIIMNWATHGWESDWAMRVGLHWWITTKFSRMAFWFFTGTSYGFNQWAGRRFNMTWDEGRKHIVNKSAKCMPLITRKLKLQTPWWRRAPWWVLWERSAVGKDIDLIEGSISRFSEDHVHYDTDSGPKAARADVVVLATGYEQRFPFLRAQDTTKVEEDGLPSEHFVVDPEEPKLAYIGFIRPNVGAIPPMAELQAMWWCEKLENKLVCTSPDYYKLKGSRLCYGVDYGYYMFALAREIGAIPSLTHWLWKDPRVAIAAAFGQAHVPLFRCEGPFADAGAVDTCRTELFDMILRRPFFMNCTFVVEAVGLGLLNLLICALERAPGVVFLSSLLAVSYIGLPQALHKKLCAPPF